MISSSEKKFIRKVREEGGNVYKREISVDNKLIDIFFSSSDGLYSEQIKQIKFEDSKKLDEINYIINTMLPDIERQVVYLLFFLKKNQETVGRLLKISQEMVYYYKKRALSRIKIHYFFRSIDIEKMEEFLKNHVTKKQCTAMMEYFKEHDLRKIAKKIVILEKRDRPIHYEAIGSRIKLGLRKIKFLKENVNDEDLKKRASLYFEIFYTLKKYNSLHHTQSKKPISKEILA